ncbi:MAG TPA: CsgG/HfaB family protein [Caulobacteraceae bacterium]|jgi:curli biogenesis system outer membrane secretion channel CsgG
MKTIVRAVMALGAIASLAVASPAAAQYGMDKKQPKDATTPELPRCDRALGTAAVKEPENRWWVGMGLSSPEALLKLFAARSGCLRIVDRNGGLAMHNEEEGLAQSGELRRSSNVGRGQVAAADYFIVPDIANSNTNSGGNALGAVAGSFLPGGFGALAGSLRTKKAEAQVLITLVNARTTEQVYVAEGAAQKTDISFGAGGGGGGWGGFAAAAGGGYSNTDQGKVITAAYFNAFVDLVHYMQSNAAPEPGSASATSGIQAYTATKPTSLRTRALGTAKALRSFAPGDLVYPTGQKNGIWWEADDENGNRGWVLSTAISPR